MDKVMTTWNGGSLIPEELREAASAIGAAVRLGGVELQEIIIKDCNRILNAYPGWNIVNGKQIVKYPNILNQVGELHKDKLVIPDIDAILVNPKGKVVLVISSKGSLQDDKLYSSIFHYNYFKEKGIEFWVVTKDTKRTFESGESKYFAFIPPNMKIFINNEDTYNDLINHNFEKWNFNDIVRPYPEIFNHFMRIITNHKDSSNTTFFDFNN
jgi:hypothetical protein